MLSVIGIGQAGGSIADNFASKGIDSLVINYSQKDLDSCENIDDKKKLKLVGTEGVGKQRDYAIQLMNQNWESTLNFIKNHVSQPSSELIFVVFSTAGGTGSGKSVFLNQLLLSLILNVPIEMLNIYLIDPKMVEFSQFNGFPQVKQVITDARKACQLLNMLCEQMDERYSMLAANGCKNIDAYNKKKKGTMPYIVLVIDEYADLLMVNEEIEEYIVRLSQKARACGIHLIIATQKPLEKIVTSVLKSNLPSVIGFKLKTSSDYRTVFGKGIPYNLTGMGDGIAMLEGYEDEFIRFQSPIISTDELEEEQIIKDIKKLLPNGTSNNFEKEIEITPSEQPIDKLKRIIATTRETRIGELRKAMGIRINIVSDLMKQLCDEGWIKKDGRNYVITVDEQTLNEWRDQKQY